MATGRIDSLDLIRGVAVLGILAINIAGFAQPSTHVIAPAWPGPASHADALSFAAKFVLFEGKMRALFSLLFGASLALFVRQRDDAGRFGDLLQARRLGWLAVIGLLHFYLLWWGDILFIYACAGIIALFMREMETRPMLVTAGAIFAIWHIGGAVMDLPLVTMEEQVRLGTASASQAESYAAYERAVAQNIGSQTLLAEGGFWQMAAYRIGSETLRPLETAFTSMGETLPLMLLGMVLQRSGFFAGSWPRGRVIASGLGALALGTTLTALLLGWAWPRGFPIAAMQSILSDWTAPAHLLMAFGYAALLVLATEAIARTLPGKALVAAGRTAFSNYIGTSLVMQAVFMAWGLGLFGRYGDAALWPFVVAAWAAMLLWSPLWLKRYRRGPLEWAWRSLVEKQILPNRR
ncbi:MAG: DUF418 domain-containing protein [Sphingomonadaceae bacterium]